MGHGGFVKSHTGKPGLGLKENLEISPIYLRINPWLYRFFFKSTQWLRGLEDCAARAFLTILVTIDAQSMLKNHEEQSFKDHWDKQVRGKLMFSIAISWCLSWGFEWFPDTQFQHGFPVLLFCFGCLHPHFLRDFNTSKLFNPILMILKHSYFSGKPPTNDVWWVFSSKTWVLPGLYLLLRQVSWAGVATQSVDFRNSWLFRGISASCGFDDQL